MADGNPPMVPTAPSVLLERGLRARGIRLTRQRGKLGALLFSQGPRHVTAEQLWNEAIAARLDVSLATVYNTLKTFEESGLVRRIAAGTTQTYFDTDPSSHQHFLVEGENRLLDVPGESAFLASIPEPPDGYEIVDVDVLIRIRSRVS